MYFQNSTILTKIGFFLQVRDTYIKIVLEMKRGKHHEASLPFFLLYSSKTSTFDPHLQSILFSFSLSLFFNFSGIHISISMSWSNQKHKLHLFLLLLFHMFICLVDLMCKSLQNLIFSSKSWILFQFIFLSAFTQLCLNLLI